MGLRQNHRSHRPELDLRDRFPHGETPGSPETRRHRGRGGGAEDVRFRPDLPAGGAAGAGARASPARRGSPPGSRSLPSCLSGAGAVGPRPRPCRPRRSAPHLEHGGIKVTAASPRVRTQAWLPRHLSRGVAGRRALCPPGRPTSGAEDGAWRGRRGRGQGPRPRGMFQKETSITRHLNPSVPHGKAATGPPGPSASRASKRLGVTRTMSTCQDPAPSLPRASLSGSNDAPRDRPPWTGRTMTA